MTDFDRDLRALRARQWAKFFVLTCLGGALGGVAVSQALIALPVLFGSGLDASYWAGTAVLLGLVGAIVGLGVGIGVGIAGSVFRVLRIQPRALRSLIAYLFAAAGSAPAWLLICWKLIDLGWAWLFVIALPAAAWLYRKSREAN